MNKQEIIEKYKPNYKVSEEHIRNIDLYKYLYELNNKYFNYGSWINDTTIKWSGRLIRVAGKGWNHKGKNLIKLSVDYHRQNPTEKEIKATVAHEMIHLKINGHGHDFRSKMHEINNKAGYELVRRYSKHNARVKYVFVCPNHGVVSTYSKKPRYGDNYICSTCEESLDLINIPEND